MPIRSEEERAKRREYYHRKKQQVIAYALQWRGANLDQHYEGMRRRSKQRRMNNPVGYILAMVKARANTKGLEFNLTAEDIVIPERCPVLGIPLFFDAESSRAQRCPNAPSLDRIDSSKGYVKGNVIIMSWRANHLKNDGTADEFRMLTEWMNANSVPTEE